MSLTGRTAPQGIGEFCRARNLGFSMHWDDVWHVSMAELFRENGSPSLYWVKKAFRETQRQGCTVVMLIPARTNTRWFHDYCMKAAELRFINGRPKFGGARHGLPQPLILVVFRKHRGATKLSAFAVNGEPYQEERR